MADAPSWLVLIRALVSLGAVIALIYGLAWFVKKYMKPERWNQSVGGQIKVLQSLPLDARKRLVIIEVEEKRLLVGVADQSISLICPLASTADGGGL